MSAVVKDVVFRCMEADCYECFKKRSAGAKIVFPSCHLAKHKLPFQRKCPIFTSAQPNIMKKRLVPILFLFSAAISAQQPYIVPTEGLGQYAYLEVNATTYARLNSSTFNVRGLGARWWTGAEYIYYSGDPGNCIPQTTSTENYASSNHPNWNAGTIAYVSVKFRQCTFDWSTTNYNERSFQLIDVDNAYGFSFDDIITDNPTGAQNLVGSFTVNTGGNALTLDRLWITNTGTAQEGTDIPNDGIRVYYEAITGSESYDGTESFGTLYGNYSGNNTTNEEWGNDDLNLPVGAAGVRCYMVVSDLAVTSTTGRTILSQIQNDGISFQEVRDGSYNKLRINTLSVGPSAAVLPVELLGFRASHLQGAVKLTWETASEHGNDRFEIERSAEGTNWSVTGVVNSHNSYSSELQTYTFEDKTPLNGLNYYRLNQIDLNGASTFSPIVTVNAAPGKVITVSPNIITNEVIEVTLPSLSGTSRLQLFDGCGRLLQRWTVKTSSEERVQLDIAGTPAGLLWLQLDGVGPVRLLKI